MSTTVRSLVIAAIVFVALIIVIALAASWFVANNMLHDPVEDRDQLTKTPADFGLTYEDVFVTTPSGIGLNGWYIPSLNGAAVILQHGYQENRQHMLEEAAVLAEHGYGVLLISIRGHDANGEEMITFGCYEMEDLDTWNRFLLAREEIDPSKIGIMGQSMGGSLAIQYARENEDIKTVVAHSPLTSVPDTIEIALKEFSAIPDPLVPILQPLVIMWGEKISGCEMDSIDAKKWIGDISPRPVLVICGGKDNLVIEENCRSLFAQAKEPADFWFEETCAHHDCDTVFPYEFARRLIDFHDQFLLAGDG